MKLMISRFRTAAGSMALLATLVLCMAPVEQAAAWDIDVRTASMGLIDGQWQLTARIDYRLTSKALEALDNGLVLTFRMEVKVDRIRNWLPNAAVVSEYREWELSYEPLTERYVVVYPDDRQSTSHGTLFGALNALGWVQALPVAEEGVFRETASYQVAVRAVLDQQRLPSPLRLLTFWDRGLSLESDWYEWRMTP